MRNIHPLNLIMVIELYARVDFFPVFEHLLFHFKMFIVAISDTTG